MAYRVLLLLANHAHSDGRNAWKAASDVADVLGVSVRTVRRGFAELKDAGLIREGEQALTAHMRADRRPTVYDLNFTFAAPGGRTRLQGRGDKSVTPSGLVDNPSDGVTTAVTPYPGRPGVDELVRGDEGRSNGVTAVVRHKNQNLNQEHDLTTSSSVNETTLLASVEEDLLAPSSPDDDFSDRPTPVGEAVSASVSHVVAPTGLVNVLREVHPRLDARRLLGLLAAAGTVRVDTLDVEGAAIQIVAASPRALGDPTAYVARAILTEPWRFVKQELLDQLPQALAPAAGRRVRSDVEEAADVRSARARGLVDADWPEHRPLPLDVLGALTAARRADLDTDHNNGRRQASEVTTSSEGTGTGVDGSTAASRPVGRVSE